MHRFFLKQPIREFSVLTGPDVIHIQKVLRLRAGDAVTVCDGNGFESDAVILSLRKDGIDLKCKDPVRCASEPSVKITLFQSLPKSGKMETVIQKSVELGVSGIIPMLTERCVSQPKDSFSTRIERWQRVSEEAAKQSRRGIIPPVGELCTPDTIRFQDYDLILVAYENERSVTLKERLKGFTGSHVAIIIGPEGGFSDEEIGRFKEHGAAAVSLGPRILRTETAGMAMVAQILYEVEP